MNKVLNFLEIQSENFLCSYLDATIISCGNNIVVYDVVNMRISERKINDYGIVQRLDVYDNETIAITFENTNFDRSLGYNNYKTVFLDKQLKELRIIEGYHLSFKISEKYLIIHNSENFIVIRNQSLENIYELNQKKIYPKAFSENVLLFSSKSNIGDIIKIHFQKDVISLDKFSFSTLKEGSKFKLPDVLLINQSIILFSECNDIYFYSFEGNLIKKIEQKVNDKNEYGNYYHDHYQNKLIKLFRDTLHEVDLDTHEIKYFEIPKLKDKDAEPNGGKWGHDDKYIFYCSLDGTTVNALNKLTKELDWQHQHNQNVLGIDIVNEVPVRYQSVQLHQSRLFVLDNKRSLHIFEKEDMPRRKTMV